MGRTGAVPSQGLQMGARGITLMPGKTVLGVVPVEGNHLGIAFHFGKDGGRADGGNGFIALDNRLGFEGEIGNLFSIHQHSNWRDGQRQHRPAHGQQGCLENIQGIDFRHLGPAHGPGEAPFPNRCCQFLAALWGEHLGVAYPRNRDIGIQYHGGRQHGPCQGTSARFIDTRHENIVTVVQSSFPPLANDLFMEFLCNN